MRLSAPPPVLFFRPPKRLERLREEWRKRKRNIATRGEERGECCDPMIGRSDTDNQRARLRLLSISSVRSDLCMRSHFPGNFLIYPNKANPTIATKAIPHIIREHTHFVYFFCIKSIGTCYVVTPTEVQQKCTPVLCELVFEENIKQIIQFRPSGIWLYNFISRFYYS